MRNHVIVCGWNEKVRAHTRSRQGRGPADEVVLVAEREEEYPLEKYRFNPIRHLLQGRHGDATVLRRAGVEHASVIIVRRLRGQQGAHRKSI